MRAILVDGSSPRVSITRERGGPLRVESALIELGASQVGDAEVRLVPPVGWRAERQGPRSWRAWPLSPASSAVGRFRFVRVPGDSTATADLLVTVRLRFDLTSAFDPSVSALLLPNRAQALGERPPQRALFARTWPSMPRRLARLLFDGLYSDIVFLSAGPRRGGLCSGMARWAIARSLGIEPLPATTAAALERITVYHGRQLRDRALLSALPWFLRGSPSAAFRAVRRDLLAEGMCDRALDLAVPKLWRRDLIRALVAEGHTVVPIRLRQDGERRGSLEVYDPNHPEAIDSDAPRRIEFDLARGRYAYGSLVSMEQHNVGIVAVREAAYVGAGTALLATLGSLLFAPRRGLRSLLGWRAWAD